MAKEDKPKKYLVLCRGRLGKHWFVAYEGQDQFHTLAKATKLAEKTRLTTNAKMEVHVIEAPEENPPL